MKNYTEQEIYSLIKRFEARKLPRNEWNHNAHLIIAIWYDRKNAAEQAINLVRENIIKHNESIGTPNSDEEGYHHTVTVFWLRIAKEFMKSKHFNSIADACNSFIASKFSDVNFPLEYYSKEVLFSLEARQGWVRPDKKELGKL